MDRKAFEGRLGELDLLKEQITVGVQNGREMVEKDLENALAATLKKVC